MVNPVTKLTIDASPLGSELDIIWELPAVLPENYKLYVFKKSGEAPSQTIIDDYFANIGNLTGFNYQGVFVFDKLANYTKVIGDYFVKNGLVYYYSAVLRNETNAEYSVAVTEHATADYLVKSDILDGKDIVATVIDKLFDTIKYKVTDQKVDLRKEINVVKNFSTAPIETDKIMIERINSAEAYRFFGDMMNQYKGMITLGGLDNDVIRATYITPGTPDRRDMISNIFRARKFWIRIMLKKLGAKDAGVVIEGDYYNPMFHGENVIGFTLVMNLLVENKTQYELPEITQHITDMEII